MIIRYLGQVGFLFQHHGLTVVIDPYLSDSVAEADSIWVRNYRPPVQPHALHGVDLVLCTHDHGDHTDPESLLGILSASPKCHFAGPKISAREMERAGIPQSQITVLNEDSGLTLRDLTVEPVAAAHEEYETDPEGHHRFLGYLLHWDGITLYHAGDTVVTPELENAVGQHAIEIGFLPINGRSDERHKQDIVGNMDAAEAIRFSAALAKKKGFHLLVPTHYDLFAINGAELAHFAAIWEKTPEPKPKFRSFRPGEQIVYQRSS
ncbi:MAG: MBL fold metallo-hydrolase [Methylacidiphilales bacterium]|nr:MBL fold metallo-hydrolase [Candidatus Methylacidiphilales bacterium]